MPRGHRREGDEESKTTDAEARSSAVAPEPDAEAEAETLSHDFEGLLAEQSELRERLLRSLADFENFRKRARREQEESVRRSVDAILRDLLDVLDDVERGLEHAASADDARAVREGIEIIHRSFRDLLARYGVAEMPSLGEAFDPNRHEAVMEEAGPAPSGRVTRVLRIGYLRDGRVLRPAQVAVSR